MADRAQRIVGRLLVASVVLAVGAVAAWWYVSYSDVVVRVDGRSASVRTRADTVAGVLRDRGVTLDAHDRVSPPLDADVADGTTVTVDRARSVVLELNGAARSVWTTGETVGDALDELGLEADVVEPEPSERLREGAVVVVRNLLEVVVVADGEERTLTTPAETVAELLAAAGIEVDGDDEVTPGLDEGLVDGSTVEVSRVDTDLAVEEHAIPFPTERRDDASLPRGHVDEIQAGRSGLERVEYRLTRRDGAVVDRTLERRTRVREPVPRIVVVGTKPPTYQSGQASWYSAASMTCAHRTLPFGTRVTVVNVGNGAAVVCRVSDRGPFVAGRVVDLAHDAFSQLADPGVGVISVRISW